MRDNPFDFQVPVTFFEKADAAAGKQRRIGGVITTESPDRQGEVILQKGLDFDDFITYGWYNDNHDKSADGILGYPELVKFFRKGETLPNGDTMPADGHWAEGYLLETEKGNRIWELGKALQKTRRRLGFSVEGSIQERGGRLQKTIAKARVKHVAITHVPVQGDSKLELLAKSLASIERCALEKNLAMGTATPGAPPPAGQAGVGQALARESLDGQRRLKLGDEGEDEEKPVEKSLTDAEAIAWVQSRCPQLSLASIGRLVDATKALKRQGRL